MSSISNATRASQSMDLVKKNNKGQIVLESAIIFCIIIAFFMFIFYKVIHPVNVMMVREYKDYMLDTDHTDDVQNKVEGRIEVTEP